MFCLITPVFDGCCESLSLLIQDLQKQSCTDFLQVLVSNGLSVIVKDLLENIDDKRFVYHELPQDDTSTPVKLIENLGKRRNFCMKNFTADRYFFFDADLKIIDNNFLKKIGELHYLADIIVSKVVYNIVYPVLPIKKGNIDLANYCISNKIAQKYNYPTQYDDEYDVAFDWRFFESISNESMYFSNIIYSIKNGNNKYKTVSNIYTDWVKAL